MSDLFQTPYSTIYEALNRVRETFHREGRISDSNAKLDETVKLLAVHFAAHSQLLSERDYLRLLSKTTFSVEILEKLFIQTASQPLFETNNGQKIFGRHPKLSFETDDQDVAYELFQACGYAFNVQRQGQSLDILNEAFGHHVRDNFRSHIEDAQYMTPPEVIDFMVGLASREIFVSANPPQNFTMMDPSCGVGSFVASWRREFDKRFSTRAARRMTAIGQDKVERMARLSAINQIFSGNKADKIFTGNSLLDGSPLDGYNGKVDLILTNPPFGAKFSKELLTTRSQNSLPFFAKAALNVNAIDSEYLFIDRYLTLLKPGGYCLAVVPDGVISAKGTGSIIRQHLAQNARIVAVVELPPETFAQAGTRTKTAVLVFQKFTSPAKQPSAIFFGEAKDLGFEVTKRKGVPVKKETGKNELPQILEAFNNCSDTAINGLLAVWRNVDPLRVDSWTPRQFYQRQDQREVRNNSEPSDTKILGDLVEPIARRRAQAWTIDHHYISVLHVIGEGLLDLTAVFNYRPVTPGIPVNPGEVIISRINPRIPRVIVVPDLGKPLLCSSEFEILKPRHGISSYALAYLLMSSSAQQQIQALTAGTSASHSRVKSERLYDIRLVWPKGRMQEKFREQVNKYEQASTSLISALRAISELRKQESA